MNLYVRLSMTTKTRLINFQNSKKNSEFEKFQNFRIRKISEFHNSKRTIVFCCYDCSTK